MNAPVFQTLDDVEYGRVDQVSPLVRRVIAENPSKFTYRGTGTYLIGHGDVVVVVDPGPELDSHRDALALTLRGERVRGVLITHCHADHSPLAAWMSAEHDAPTFGYGSHPRPDPGWAELERDVELDDEPIGDRVANPVMEESTDYDFVPTERVGDGARLEFPGLTITAVHTPGHTSNHICWALDEESALFTGDHVMGWSTTVVSPPDGDMVAYLDSLRRVADRADAVLWPTHGPPRYDGPEYASALVEHRLGRERAILAVLDRGPATVAAIVEELYVDVRRELHRAARRSVWAHLIGLVTGGRVEVEGSGPAALAARYRRLGPTAADR